MLGRRWLFAIIGGAAAGLSLLGLVIAILGRLRG